MDTSPYLAEMSANKRSVGLELKHAEGRRGGAGLAGQRRRVRHELLDAGGAGARPRLRGRRRRQPEHRLRRAARLRLRRRPSRTTSSWRGVRTRRRSSASTPSPAIPTRSRPASPPSPRPTTSPACTRWPPCSPGSSTATAPARAASSTSPSSRRPCRASGRSCSTTRSAGACRSARATGWPGWRRRAATRAPATTRGWPSPSPTTSSGRRWPTCSAATRRRRRLRGAGRAPGHHDELDALHRCVDGDPHGRPRRRRRPAGGRASPAYEVLDNIGVLHDPQVRDRRWFQLVASTRFPDGDVFSGHPIRLADTPGQWWRAGPSMGQDTVEVLTKRAGLSPTEVDALLASGRRLHRGGARADAAPPVHRLRRDPRRAAHGGVMSGPWAGVRVVELTGLTGAYATRMWAALGADVVVVEPPGGHVLRHLPPFAPGHDGPDASLWWAFFAQGKRRSVAEPGSDEYHRLVASADVVIGDVDPARGAPAPAHDRQVVVAISPFGLTGTAPAAGRAPSSWRGRRRARVHVRLPRPAAGRRRPRRCSSPPTSRRCSR